MMFQYSAFSSPNTPVDVCTVVGRCGHLLDSKLFRPKPGQTLRIVNGKVCYLNVLKDCTRANLHKQLQRQFVDLDVDVRPLHDVSRVVGLSPEKCSVQCYIKACNLASNTVCFIDDSIEKLASNYLSWIECCMETVVEPVKPTAIVVLCGSQSAYNKTTLTRAFTESCISTASGAGLYGLAWQCFRKTDALYYSKLSNPQNRLPVNCRLLDMVERLASETGQLHGYYWRENSVHKLFSQSLSFFSKATTSRRRFSIALALSVDIPNNTQTLRHRTGFFNHSLAPQEVFKAAVPLLGMYMAYHLLAHSPLLDIENFKLPDASNKALFDLYSARDTKCCQPDTTDCFLTAANS
ncbi:hypothetical protein GQ44DRAFT_732313 [Phaeosphaeriaceae sp. PMI808]|nr:hypothetical protein GQ44DRAFT_732313 [Phaeosphaeriaceae sp. PMI808]